MPAHLKALHSSQVISGPGKAPSLTIWIARKLHRAYKITLSPLFGDACRFTPYCSDYALEAIEKYGIVRGLWLALKRISRCHPFHNGGEDPVP